MRSTKWDGYEINADLDPENDAPVRVLPGGKILGVDYPADVQPKQQDDMGDGWYGSEWVWRECGGVGVPAREHQSYGRTEVLRKCAGCELVVPEDHPFLVKVDGRRYNKLSWPIRVTFPHHEIAMNVHEQAEERISQTAVAMGFDRHDDVVLHARYSATRNEATRIVGNSVDAMVAYGVGLLSNELSRRAALPAAEKEMRALLSFRLDSNDWLTEVAEIHGYPNEEVPDEAPFFSEAVLYALLGKEDARTVLAYVHRAARAVGAA